MTCPTYEELYREERAKLRKLEQYLGELCVNLDSLVVGWELHERVDHDGDLAETAGRRACAAEMRALMGDGDPVEAVGLIGGAG